MALRSNHYLDSAGGHLARRRSRRRRILWVRPIEIEPKSKKATSHDDKLKFQNCLLEALRESRRCHFRGPVALELDFFPTENDPPAVHTMAKNYLDLLQSPVEGLRTRRKRLVLADDRQVQYLAVKYHVSPGITSPSVRVRVAPYSNLIEDAALLHQVKLKRIGADSRYAFGFREELPSWDDLSEDLRDKDYDDAWDRVRKLEKERAAWVSHFGKDVYDVWHQMLLGEAQVQLLKTLSLSPDGLIELLKPSFGDNGDHFRDLDAVMREMMISHRFSISLKHSNLRRGESSVFKKLAREAIRGFRKTFKRLFPLHAQVGVTIFFRPPAAGGIDLDNLARRIIPFVNEELRPPSNLIFTIDTSKISDPRIKVPLEKNQERLRRMPRPSVTHYQVVQLPRLVQDDENGFVRLLLEPGQPFDTLWNRVEGLANKWQELAERR